MSKPNKRKRTVYTHTASTARSVTSTAGSSNRIREDHRPLPPPSPEKWRARAQDDFDALMNIDTWGEGPPLIAEGPAAIKIRKAKRYEKAVGPFNLFHSTPLTPSSQDNPVKTWIPHRDQYLDRMMRLEGRGAWWTKGCAQCKESNPTWRCEDCFGGRMLCMSCCISRHQDEPLHLLQVIIGCRDRVPC